MTVSLRCDHAFFLEKLAIIKCCLWLPESVARHYIAIGIDMEGHKDVLGIYVGQNESTKFWLSILNGLKNRGVEDILIACVDGLTGFPQAIEAVFPDTEIQQCIYTSDPEYNKVCFLQGTQAADG